jgi:uncharacterized protein (TIGR04255 family)
MQDKRNLPEFEQPPVIEVVCGVLFRNLDALLAPHLGLLWDKYRSEYPSSEERNPLWPVVEPSGDELSPSVAVEGPINIPSLPRVWFVSEDDTSIIQVQRDRFLCNWREGESKQKYPRFQTVFSTFRKRLDVFVKFLSDESIGSLEPLQYELTYVNHIPKGEGWTSLADIGNVVPDFAWRAKESRFLDEPEIVNWQSRFLLPDGLGRLHVTLRLVLRASDRLPMLRFDLTARGIQKVQSEDSMHDWFEVGHEWIVRGFTDLTAAKAHNELWRRKK